jgi:hypothetical protein
MPLDANKSITLADSGSIALVGSGGPIRTETTQSLHAISRAMQLSQSMIIKRRYDPALTELK